MKEFKNIYLSEAQLEALNDVLKEHYCYNKELSSDEVEELENFTELNEIVDYFSNEFNIELIYIDDLEEYLQDYANEMILSDSDFAKRYFNYDSFIYDCKIDNNYYFCDNQECFELI